ncbi:MAG: hydantoinase B/oxoprolinase family protein [Burkholderiales bacterium]|nr:hydantoinase B/oxoprolinase family protein [Burkholderiales bacterium]
MDARVKEIPLDPVTLEVIRNALPAISNEMAIDLQRTSYNMIIYEVRDFCTALVRPNGELVSQNVGGVSHFIADLGVMITDAMRRYDKEGFQPGDVLISNHQRVAGQHLNNVCIHMPYFHEGELLMFAIVRAHWIDVGGTSTGFGAGLTVADPWLEGLQLDQLKLYRGGVLDQTLYRVIRDNIRYPESSLGDMKSQMAACRLALRRLDELFGKYGRDTVLAAIERIFAQTERKCRNVVASFPDGVYEAESVLDDDGLAQGEPVRLHARVSVRGGEMSIDMSGCSGERRSAMNSRTLAAPRIAYKALTAPNEPVNEGSFRALQCIIPEGNIMMARYPAPMAHWSVVLPMVVDTIVAALARAIPERVPAAHFGLMGNNGVFFGMDPNTRRRFVISASGGGGWGGRPFEDGESATCTVCQGDVRNASIEELEMKSPVLVRTRGLRADSGGPGRFRGGLGSTMQVRNLAEGRWNMERQRRQHCPPWGVGGGLPGQAGMKMLKLPGEPEFKDVDLSRHLVPAGSEVLIHAGSGGGWGDPLARDPERVRWDVIEGLVSEQSAHRDYGVVFGENRALDPQATAALRSRLAAHRSSPSAARRRETQVRQ